MTEMVVVGMSHRTAPLALREKAHFPAPDVPGALAGLCALPHVEEAVLLSTCNRSEIYAAARDVHAGAVEIRGWLGETRGLDADALAPALYEHSGADAVAHLFRVASSLDSMVVGEPQIGGQVKDAYALASAAGTVGPTLHRSMHRAFAVAKRVRSETSIGRKSVSVSSVAVDLARHVLADLAGRRVLLLGAGKMSRHAARHLRDAGCDLLLANRSFDRAVELAREFDAHPRAWEEIDDALLVADVVLAATGSPTPILGPERVGAVMRRRQFRPIVIVDIAVPRDVDPRVGDLENVYLFDLDALQKALAGNLAARAREARDAEALVQAEVRAYVEWARRQSFVPTIKELRDHFTRVARAEEERLLRDLPHLGADERRKIRLTLDAVVNKLLHAPLTALKSEDGPEDLASAARRLFDLHEAAAGARPDLDGKPRES